eukprot:CAMPEP_0173397324 /NCGR_PEP_ID=MMETSP1356-20130122/38051_1 /TAXON_ID=77927 ORGANISM="Hemiselmis virescens, Strain PCC157" /NCGR_SAMPLE_ID=MMETSP1356 /ASSEMBLY_ACC=CAM_ASM_000847 /LENGTH=83 /DNA_ID=CAMNT_0014356559 /DNA_START=39 /DNA_END=286 /DNA_ORIENTATION=-
MSLRLEGVPTSVGASSFWVAACARFGACARFRARVPLLGGGWLQVADAVNRSFDNPLLVTLPDDAPARIDGAACPAGLALPPP